MHRLDPAGGRRMGKQVTSRAMKRFSIYKDELVLEMNSENIAAKLLM